MIKSQIHRYITSDGSARLIFADTTEIVQNAMDIHGTSPTASAALGRVLTAASIMGSLMKNPSDSLTLRVKGDGVLGAVVAVSDYEGNVRGYVENPLGDLPVRADGKLDVGGAIGEGTLYVMRDLGGREPYVGMCQLVSGEIAEDITAYFAQSEQTPSVCALGVLVGKDGICLCSGGFIIQLLPGTWEETVVAIENNVKMFTSVTALMKQGKTADDFAELLFAGIEYEKFDTISTEFRCNCSKENYERGIISLGKDEIDEMIDEGKDIQTQCVFCGKTYPFTVDELKELVNKTTH